MSQTTSIAVLPFKNRSTDQENEFFCDGISEEIINAFSKIQQLKVISRTSSFYFKNRQASIKEIGDRLKVNILLEGSVRVSGNLLRITAQLIEVKEDASFWSQTWDRKMDNLFEIQDEISLLIADKLREYIGHLDISEHLVNSPTKYLSAYKHCLKGKFHFNKWNPVDTNIAIQEFDKAIAIDPTLIDGHLGIADAYSFLAVAGFAPREEAWMKATEALKLAKKINASHAGLNYMLANQAFFTDADFSAAMNCVLNALASEPTHSDSQRFISFLYIISGAFKKAKDHLFYAKSIDPINPETLFYEAFFYYRTKKYEQASVILNDLLQENEANIPAIITSIYVKIKQNQLEEARTQLETTPEALLTPDERLGLFCLIEATENTGDFPNLKELIQHSKGPEAHHAHSYLYLTFCRQGRYKAAFEVLNHLFEFKSSILLLSFSDPLTENIHQEPPYQGLHNKIYPRVKPEKPIKKPKPALPEDSLVEKQLAQLHEFMEMEKPYLNPSLTLRLLANQTAIHPNQLSWLLNEKIGKNFNEYINQRRIEHFKKIVVNPSNSHISLLGLAYESGFNSKTVFNTAFKKTEGMTPKQYQKSQLKG